MKQSLRVCVMLFVGVAAVAQLPSSTHDSPSIKVSFPNTPHNANAATICAVDFRNITLVRDYKWSVKLNEGEYEHEEKMGGFKSVSLGDVNCFGVQDSVPRYAVVDSTWAYGYGSSSNECVVQVFTLRSERPVVVQQFEFDCHAQSTGAKFNARLNRLTIRARTNDDSPHCCAKTLDVVTYDWRDGKFVRHAFRRIPATVQKDSNGLERH